MNNKGMLITIDGVDGSGKTTQIAKLYERLRIEGYNVIKIKYPRYENESSALVRMYLRGEFGDNAKEISPYIASTFYAVDRYASYKQDYENFYNNGGIVIADRYVTANMVHQAGKINDLEERNKFLDWLWKLEFGMYKIPVPDAVFFLDVPIEFSKKIIQERNEKSKTEVKKDIHENDTNHLTDSYNNARGLVDKYNWIRIECVKEKVLRDIDDIHSEIYQKVVNKINK